MRTAPVNPVDAAKAAAMVANFTKDGPLVLGGFSTDSGSNPTALFGGTSMEPLRISDPVRMKSFLDGASVKKTVTMAQDHSTRPAGMPGLKAPGLN